MTKNSDGYSLFWLLRKKAGCFLTNRQKTVTAIPKTISFMVKELTRRRKYPKTLSFWADLAKSAKFAVQVQANLNFDGTKSLIGLPRAISRKRRKYNIFREIARGNGQ
jgi:hypothetical protein